MERWNRTGTHRRAPATDRYWQPNQTSSAEPSHRFQLDCQARFGGREIDGDCYRDLDRSLFVLFFM